MPKRQIKGKVGKQLYLNKIFNRGMLHTSSEMQEGYVKTISNFDITPTGDAATPRQPYAAVASQHNMTPYTYPVQFQQAAGLQHYVEFVNTVSEKDFVEDIISQTPLGPSIKMYSRGNQSMANVIYSECLDENGEFVRPLHVHIDGYSTVDLGPVDFAEDPDDLELQVQVKYVPDTMIGAGVLFDRNNNEPWLVVPEEYLKARVSDPSEERELHSANVIDFDTIDFNDGNTTTRVRLLGIDSPEENFPWYIYGRKIAEKLLSKVTHFKLVTESEEKDSYGRSLCWVMISYDEGQTYYLLNALAVMLGLAKVRYAMDNYRYTDLLISLQSEARKDNRLMWNKNLFDPTHPYTQNDVRIRNDFLKGSTLEVLRITKTKKITYNLSNTIDQVEFKYIDYLDSIAFLGRFIKDGTILYKGLILLKCVEEDGLINFDLEVAENDGEGYIPNINEALTTGYNLYNTQLVNVNNSANTSYSTDILGVIATNPYNPEEIVLSAPTGASVNLHGVINESYLTTPSIPMVNNVKYKAFARIDMTTTIQVNWYLNETEHPDYKEVVIFYPAYERATLGKGGTIVFNESPLGSSVVLGLTPIKEIQEEFKEKNPKFEGGLHTIVFHRDGSILNFDGVPDSINPAQLSKRDMQVTPMRTFTNFNLEIQLEEPTLHKVTYNLVPQDESLRAVELTNKKYAFNIYDILSFALETNIGAAGDYIEFKLKNNLNNISKRFVIENGGSYSPDTIQETTQALPQRYLQSIWEKSTDGAGWTNIHEPFIHYIVKDGFVEKVNKNDTNYINYTIDSSTNISIRYNLRPVYELTDGVYIYNSYETMSHTYPMFKVSNSWETLSNEMLRRNLIIRNATRIGYYNRSIFLYGEHIKSNVVQFSMFEKAWYFPFPFYNIQVDEKIIHIHPHKNSLIIFGQYNIYMLMEGSSALDFQLFKIYENLSVDATDINTVVSIGNNVMFFNKQVGYVIVPNKYTNDPTNIAVYKMTDNISNLLLSPDLFIRLRTRYAKDVLTRSIIGKFHTFVSDNVINLIVSYTMHTEDDTLYLTVIYRYDQAFKYWSLYDFSLGEEIHSPYICEPQIGYQFMLRKDGKSYLLKPITTDLPLDFESSRIDIGLDGLKPISAFIDSGYLSVDTMNDKRFKDLLFEFNNIEGATLTLFPNFYVDGAPQVLTDTQSIVGTPMGDYVIEGNQTPITLKPANTQDLTGRQKFSQGFIIDGSFFTTSERVRVRVPVWGKGKMPSFTLAIESNAMYEFLNFSLIYKEKSIMRR